MLAPCCDIMKTKSKNIQKAGKAIGRKLKDQIKLAIKNGQIGRLMREYPEWVEVGISASIKTAPRACALLLGIAEGAGISFQEAFCMWYEELNFADEKDKKRLRDTGCTDIVIRDGSRTVIGHTNDEGEGAGSRLFKIAVQGLPDLFMVFTRGAPSIGLNSDGIVISGNQIDAADTRPGIPRMLLYVEACWCSTIEAAEKILLDDERASSFNNIIANESGEVISLEASARRATKLIHPVGAAAHSNHFVFLPSEEGREGRSLSGSKSRLERAINELKGAGQEISVRDVMAMMKTHGVGGLCRHGDNETHTVFSVVFLPTERAFIYAPGNPCTGSFKLYRY